MEQSLKEINNQTLNDEILIKLDNETREISSTEMQSVIDGYKATCMEQKWIIESCCTN